MHTELPTERPDLPHMEGRTGVFAASLTVFLRSGSAAAKHADGGGLNIGWIATSLVAGIVIGVLLARWFHQNWPTPKQDDQRQRENQANLEHHLLALRDHDCRDLCVWLTQHTPRHQEALIDAYNALYAPAETDTLQGDE